MRERGPGQSLTNSGVAPKGSADPFDLNRAGGLYVGAGAFSGLRAGKCYPIPAPPGKFVRIFMAPLLLVVVAPSLFPYFRTPRHPSPEGEVSEGEMFPLRQGNRLVSDCPGTRTGPPHFLRQMRWAPRHRSADIARYGFSCYTIISSGLFAAGFSGRVTGMGISQHISTRSTARNSATQRRCPRKSKRTMPSRPA